jgi:mRNA interferase RelE/StbE
LKYELVYTQRAVKDIQKLDAPIKARIGKALLRYKEAPLDFAERLTDPVIGSYRFRIGDYRVIFDIEGHDIVILRAGHRREIYKRK